MFRQASTGSVQEAAGCNITFCLCTGTQGTGSPGALECAACCTILELAVFVQELDMSEATLQTPVLSISFNCVPLSLPRLLPLGWVDFSVPKSSVCSCAAFCDLSKFQFKKAFFCDMVLQVMTTMLEALQQNLEEESEARRAEEAARADAQERCSAADEKVTKLEWESNQAAASLQRKVRRVTPKTKMHLDTFLPQGGFLFELLCMACGAALVTCTSLQG